MEKIGALANEPSTLIFEKLKEAIELKIMAAENVKRMAILLEDALNV